MSLVECWVSQLRAFGPFRGACLSAQNWSCARDWGRSWILLHTPAAVAQAGPEDEQGLILMAAEGMQGAEEGPPKRGAFPPKKNPEGISQFLVFLAF